MNQERYSPKILHTNSMAYYPHSLKISGHKNNFCDFYETFKKSCKKVLAQMGHFTDFAN